MRKINFEDVKHLWKPACEIGACVLIMMIALGTKVEVKYTQQLTEIVSDYYSTIEEIVKSDMFDSNKQRLIEILKPNANEGYYKAVKKILDSDMFDSRKISLIENLSK